MFKLFCDKCNKEVDPGKKITEIALEEFVYEGRSTLMSTMDCSKEYYKLCPDCANRLKKALYSTYVDKDTF